jgi:tight adherence protein C
VIPVLLVRLVRALAPPPPPLDEALAQVHRRPDLVEIANTETTGLSGVIGERISPRLGRLLSTASVASDRLQADLSLVGRTVEHHYGEKVLLAVFGLLLPSLMSLVMAVGGVGIGLAFPVFAGLCLALVFFFVPDLILRSQAEARRTDFRHALSSFLDLVVIGLAGGAGVESALSDAASIGQGWAFTQLRNALEVTKLTGETPWATLARLGDELGIAELPELAASVSLAGTEGARVRSSLAAKAEAMRDHAMADQEAEAQASTEKMALPVVLLFIGFLVLIGYPAVDAVLTGI